MCRKISDIGLCIIFLLSIPHFVTAQENDNVCPVLVKNALEQVGDVCSGLSRNQVCYGNAEVMALDWENTTLADFAVPGDMTGIAEVSSVVTIPLDVEQDTWGIAILAIQADLPDTLPGQNVTFVIYGDAELQSEVSPENQAIPSPTCSVTVTGGINLRSGPGTGYAVAGGLAAGDEVTVDGRNTAGDWLHLVDDTRLWVYAPLLATECDLMLLDVLEADIVSEPQYTAPMQAFQFRAGIGEAACAEAPRDGLLVQAPTDNTVHFLMNGIDIEIGSTALFLPVMDALSVNTLAGTVNVSAAGETQEIKPGYQTIISATTAPTEPEPYSYDNVRTAPVDLLAEPVDIPIIMPGNVEWFDTGVMVEAGQTFTATASGEVDVWPICNEKGADRNRPNVPCEDFIVGPDGWPVSEGLSGVQLSTAGLFSLVARIGENGAPFAMGAGGTFTADNNGTVQLVVNDGAGVWDNEGEFVVVISVDKGE